MNRDDDIAIDGLVNLWKVVRHAGEPSAFELARWRREFGTLLERKQITYDDLTQVLTALADPELELDRGRYTSPVHLCDRAGEWEHVQAQLQIALLRREAALRRTPVKPVPIPYDDGDSEKMAIPPPPLPKKSPPPPPSWSSDSWEQRRARAFASIQDMDASALDVS